MTTATLNRPTVKPPATGESELFLFGGADRDELRARLRAALDREPDAATLAAELPPGGARLAVIATSTADLHAKLRRAADRLADPACRQIRDAAGIYYFAQPLYTPGSLALLFPGEGAQYPDMLADLCGCFPEVEETFAWCDRIAAEAGQPEQSLRRVLHLPPDATAENRAAAEAHLRRLGPSIFGVLIADQAIIRVLQNLQLPISAVAGHSAGELAALLAAGAMRSEEVLGSRLFEIMELMQRQEDEASGPDVALIAVGAGRALIAEIADAVAGGAVIVAMDNCPHQCVAVGPTHLVAAVETALHERGVLCERLPFRRPYHTPLFEPWMGPFRDLFAGVPFDRPHTPVYSCSTGRRFPDDPDAIRRLAVDHWVSPVEFSGMIESMYADGVRLFVEAGPRGNLSAFVEDVLRGRPFAALPANVPRRSGLTQLHHLVGQLVAHGVPLNLHHLYGGQIATQSLPVATGGVAPAAEVITAYLETMEQFLDVQRDVMHAFFAGEPSAAPSAAYALVEQIETFTPGREVLIRRTMDEREDLYADHHTLGGRGVSRADPGQNGLPVLPMTFSLEAMAEAASLLVPGKVVVALRNIRLHRWLPFDPEPTTLEVRASVELVETDGTVEVKANVRDLGNSFLKDGSNKIASEAIVVLADQYPDAPPAIDFRLSDEQPCRCSVEDLRRNMFHGPLFQMIRTLGRTGKEGIEGELEVQPRTGWFRSNPEPRVVLDPVLMDAAMHILGAWHLEQPDWTGRILLPFEVSRIDFFGPPPPIGSRLLVRGHNEQESARHYRHGLEIFAPDGRLWLRMTGAAYWRFYLPFGHVNFFGPKDEYFLSRDWPEAILPRRPGDAPRRCHVIDPPADLRQPVLRAAGARVTMTPRELAEFRAWAGTDAELNDWFFGRMLAKDAVRAAWAEKHGERLFPADIEMELNAEGRYVARPRGEPGPEPLPPVAVAVAGGCVAAFAAFAPQIGIALVKLPKGTDGDERRWRSRAAQLAVADALRLNADVLAASEPDEADRVFVTLPGRANQRVVAQTARQKDLIVATTLCEADSA
jgi:malonyl CoA-acyl carrier protein transacylase